jgi:glycogen synthase
MCTEWGWTACCAKRTHLLTGIRNGIDPAVWNPATDAHLASALHGAAARRPRAEQGGAQGPLRPR